MTKSGILGDADVVTTDPDSSSNNVGGDPRSRNPLDQDTPTPSEKVSRWHRDIFMVRHGVIGGCVSTAPPTRDHGPAHPRSCVCGQCMAEHGTYQYYNKRIRENSRAEKKRSQEVVTLTLT